MARPPEIRLDTLDDFLFAIQDIANWGTGAWDALTPEARREFPALLRTLGLGSALRRPFSRAVDAAFWAGGAFDALQDLASERLPRDESRRVEAEIRSVVDDWR